MAYATVEQLGAEMTLENPTAEQAESMQRALDAAAEEIDWFLGYILPPDPVPALVVQVNLDRAHEHFDQAGTPFGMVTIGDEGTASIGSNGWARHAKKLTPLRSRYGVA